MYKSRSLIRTGANTVYGWLVILGVPLVGVLSVNEVMWPTYALANVFGVLYNILFRFLLPNGMDGDVLN